MSYSHIGLSELPIYTYHALP